MFALKPKLPALDFEAMLVLLSFAFPGVRAKLLFGFKRVSMGEILIIKGRATAGQTLKFHADGDRYIMPVQRICSRWKSAPGPQIESSPR